MYPIRAELPTLEYRGRPTFEAARARCLGTPRNTFAESRNLRAISLLFCTAFGCVGKRIARRTNIADRVPAPFVRATEAADHSPTGNVFWQLRWIVLFDPSRRHPFREAAPLLPTGASTWQQMRHASSPTEIDAPRNDHPRLLLHFSAPRASTVLRRTTLATLVTRRIGAKRHAPYSHSNSHNENAQCKITQSSAACGLPLAALNH